MKLDKLRIVPFILAIVTVFLPSRSMAQGCGLRLATGTVKCSCGDVTENQFCEVGGNPGDFCSVSHGSCCDTDFTTVSVNPDTSCSENLCDTAPLSTSKAKSLIFVDPLPCTAATAVSVSFRPANFQPNRCHNASPTTQTDASEPPVPLPDGFWVKSNIKAQISTSLIGKMKSDLHGNVYVQPYLMEKTGNSEFLKPAIQEIRPDGSLGPLFNIKDSHPELFGGDFYVTGTGDFHQVAWNQNGSLFVAHLAADGSFVSLVPLGIDNFGPYHLAIFNTGEILVSGTAEPRQKVPVTAVFTPEGRLIKRLLEPEDEASKASAEDYGNKFVWRGDAVAGSDGNVYLARSASPALVYVVSRKGDVVRKFKVEPPNPGALPMSIQESNGKIVLWFGFFGHGANDFSMEILDLAGNQLESYGGMSSSMTLVGYSSSRFTLIWQPAYSRAVHIVNLSEPPAQQ